MSERVSLSIVLPMPPSANRYWRAAPGRGMVPSREALAYKALVARRCAGLLPVAGRIAYHVRAAGLRANADLGNVEKILSDALNGIAWLDDSEIDTIRLERDRAPERPPEPYVAIEVRGDRQVSREERDAYVRRRQETAAKRRQTLRRNRATKRQGLVPTPATYRPRKATSR